MRVTGWSLTCGEGVFCFWSGSTPFRSVVVYVCCWAVSSLWVRKYNPNPPTPLPL